MGAQGQAEAGNTCLASRLRSVSAFEHVLLIYILAFWFVLVIAAVVVWGRVTHIPSYPQTHYVAEGDLELGVSLPSFRDVRD